jgi:hypothetical protein
MRKEKDSYTMIISFLKITTSQYSDQAMLPFSLFKSVSVQNLHSINKERFFKLRAQPMG